MQAHMSIKVPTINRPATGLLEELAGQTVIEAPTRPMPTVPPSTRYSCFLLPPASLSGLGMRVHMMHAAIIRHHHIYDLYPLAAYVAISFRTQLLQEITKITSEEIPDRTYSYRFVLGAIDKKVLVHQASSMPDFLSEIREIGLPANAIICVH